MRFCNVLRKPLCLPLDSSNLYYLLWRSIILFFWYLDAGTLNWKTTRCRRWGSEANRSSSCWQLASSIFRSWKLVGRETSAFESIDFDESKILNDIHVSEKERTILFGSPLCHLQFARPSPCKNEILRRLLSQLRAVGLPRRFVSLSKQHHPAKSGYRHPHSDD